MNPWALAVVITAIIWSLASIYLVYAATMLVIALEWKQFILAALAWTAVTLAQIAFSAMAE